MPLKIVRNDITKMNTEAIVNTANRLPIVGSGCDFAVYQAAGSEELLNFRKENIGEVKEGDVFITPGFNLSAKYIIHAVSPFYDGSDECEKKLRSCYKKSLHMAAEHNIKSIAFPLIATGSFGYPMEEGMRIAVDEINAFLLQQDMLVYLVVFGYRAVKLGSSLYPDLESYIDEKYVDTKKQEEYADSVINASMPDASYDMRQQMAENVENVKETHKEKSFSLKGKIFGSFSKKESSAGGMQSLTPMPEHEKACSEPKDFCEEVYEERDDYEILERKLEERIKHISDTFTQYLLYMIKSKGMENAEVYKRAIVDKKVFSKIKNNPDYHPQKITALCLCVGARLNLDETKDLLARAGYALSPCDKTDIIFSYFIENQIYDMIEIDFQLEEHGLPCIIS